MILLGEVLGMADANLLRVLKKEKNCRLDNMFVFGKVRCAVEKPYYLNTLNAEEGFFAILDVYAFMCKGQDYFGADTGKYARNATYFASGSILIICANPNAIGKLVKVGGSGKRGCTIKQQLKIRDSREGVHGFVFKRNHDGSFSLSPNTVSILEQRDIAGTDLGDRLKVSSGVALNEYTSPKSLESFIEFFGLIDYTEIKTDKLKESIVNPTKTREIKYEDDGERIDLSKVDMHLTKHLDSPPESKYLDIIADEVKEQSNNKDSYADKLVESLKSWVEDYLKEEYSVTDVASDIYNRYTTNIVARYNDPLTSRVKAKGKDFVDHLLDCIRDIKFAVEQDEEDKERESVNKKIEGIDEIRKAVPLNPRALSRDYSAYLSILGEDVKMATIIIGNITGIGEDTIVENYNSCHRYFGVSIETWFHTLICCPYVLGMLGGGMAVYNCDKIFFTISRSLLESYWKDECINEIVDNCFKYRDYLIILDGIKNKSNSSMNTIVKIPDLTSKYFQYYPSKVAENWKETGFPLTLVYVDALSVLFDMPMEGVDYEEYTGKNPITRSKIKELMGIGIIDMVNEDYVAFTKDMYKEFFIYKTLWERGKKPTGITDSEVEKTISEFEDEKGFKLEPLQKEGISLIKYSAAVLSGCAGSGKTTTSDAMSKGLMENLDGYTIVYGTPTGKACRRLAEVVHGTVRTLHSLFGVGIGSEPYLCRTGLGAKAYSSTNKYIYLLDEMAMCHNDLLYEVVRNLGPEDLIYFLGDIKQLPPIGRGIPFAMLMKILPCVELGVSKRSASGSLVNYNCTLINFVSDDRMVELLGDDHSFIIEPCGDVEISIKACSMFNDLMNGKYGKVYDEDDIQVITQYQDPKKLWAAPILNKPIQELLRRDDKLLYKYLDNPFYLNDRVIHVKRNCYELKRYRRITSSKYEEVVTFGAVNGEMGKIIGIVRSDMIEIKEFDPNSFVTTTDRDKELLEKWEKKRDSLRDDSQVSNDSIYFVVVQYYDTDLCEDVVVLYRARDHKVYGGYGVEEGKVFDGGDLRYLELAYALSAHKMQGSQSKAVIAVFGSTGSPQFVNRNMINVIITRSEEFVGLIGSVKGDNSAITKGRKYVSPKKRDDILGVLAGEVEI